jgi:adenosylhomocysteine nucleosidase
MTTDDFLIVIACKNEDRGIFQSLGERLIFTGAGKINATYYLTKKLCGMKRPKYVVNFGSAGSRKYKKGSLVYSNKFIQRDMDVTAFGYQPYETPSDHFPKILQHKELIDDLPNGICGSGDSFVTTQDVSAEIDLVDMEAYALARVCKLEDIDFMAIKYITDGLVEEGADAWKVEVEKSAEVMYQYWQKLVNKL